MIPGLIEPLKVPNNPANVLVFMQTAIRRGLELTDSMIRDANAFSYTPVWVNSRSLFELGSLVFDLSDNVSDLVAGWDFGRYLEFETHLAKIMLGFKSTTWHPGLDESEHLVLVPRTSSRSSSASRRDTSRGFAACTHYFPRPRTRITRA